MMSAKEAISVSFIEDICYKYSNSICQISIVEGHRETQVTGFLVGRDLVMSVYHVFHEILECSAKRAKTYAIFGFKGNSLTVGLKQYYFFDSPAYINAELDVIILQLKPDYGLPDGCTLLRERPSPYQKITFVGHPNGEPQKMALECPILSPDHRIVMESYDYFHRQNAQGGFDDVRDSNSVLVQSGIGNGAAGSPGIVPTEHTAVACMLTTGYPIFRSQLAPQDLNHTFEKAVTMHSLYKYLKNDNPRLCFSIF